MPYLENMSHFCNPMIVLRKETTVHKLGVVEYYRDRTKLINAPKSTGGGGRIILTGNFFNTSIKL